MSGTIIGRVNRSWDVATRANVSAVRFFWEWLKFVADHPGLSVVEAGTGTTSHGVAIPAEWLAWDGATDPTTLSPIALDSNSWIVFQADNADPLLNGLGGMPWQAKIQVAHTGVSYSDPSGTDHGMNGETDVVGLRGCPYGNWAGSPTWDFVPPTTEDLPPDRKMYAGQNESFVLDLVGDDDTIVWKGGAGDFPTDDPKDRSRGGYLGMIVRRSSGIAYPFFVMAGVIQDTGANIGEDNIYSRQGNDAYYVFRYSATTLQWPSFSIGADKTACLGHHITFPSPDMMQIMAPSAWNSNRNYFSGILREKVFPSYGSVMGQLRFFWATDHSYAQHTLVGDNEDMIQICKDGGTYGGILMQWPAGVLPAW